MPRPLNKPTIPSELTDLRQWVAWKYLPRGGEMAKVPCGRNGTPVSVTDEQEWMSHAEASAVPGIAGVGFVFSATGPYCGVDLDACRHKDTGDFEPEALDVLEALASYAEVSPSGTGVKIILKARMADGARHKISAPWRATTPDKHAHVECYDRSRFFTITGNVLPGYDAVTATGAAYINEMMRTPAAEAGITKTAVYISDDDVVAVATAYPPTTSVMQNLYHESRRALYGSDESRCDFALCLALARHTDVEGQIERIFRTSALFRTKSDASKWDRQDYVHRTVNAAIKEKAPERAKDMGLNYRLTRKIVAGELEEVCIPLTVAETSNQLQRHSKGAFFSVGASAYLAADAKGQEPVTIGAHSDLTAALGQRNDMCIRWKSGLGFTTRDEGFAAFKYASPKYHSIESAPTFPAWPDTYYNVPDLPAPAPEAWNTWLDFFNWTTPEDRVLGEALMLTPFWGGPGGQRPIFAVASPDGQQAGKTTVVQMACRLLGQTPISPQMGGREGLDVADLLKRMLSPEGRKSRVVLLDNVTGKLNNGDLAALVTGASVSGRQLHEGEGTRPNNVTYCLTLNAPSLDTDFATRTVEVRVSRPKGGFGDWQERVYQHLAEHRWGMVAHAIQKLREAKAVDVPQLRFPLWTRQVLGAVVGPDRIDAVAKAIFARRDEHNSDAADIEAFSYAMTKVALQAIRISRPKGDLTRYSAWIYNPVCANLYCKILNRRNMASSTALKHLASMFQRGDFASQNMEWGARHRVDGQHLTGIRVGVGPVEGVVEQTVDMSFG